MLADPVSVCYDVTGLSDFASVWGMIISLKLTIVCLVTSRHKSEMTERLLKAILNTHIPFCIMNTDKFNTADIVKFKHPEKILV